MSFCPFCRGTWPQMMVTLWWHFVILFNHKNFKEGAKSNFILDPNTHPERSDTLADMFNLVSSM